uniref:RRP15-like protein n=1 Tax=Peronospora matthiolae TaxID=2874970 RepID=A0AAV1T8W7_9STRA
MSMVEELSTNKQPTEVKSTRHANVTDTFEAESEQQDEENSNDEDEGEEDEGAAALQGSTDDEEGDEPHEAVGFGDAMSKILGQNIAEDVQPILARRTTARMREIQSDRKEVKTVRLSAAEKREREQKDMAVPDHTTAVKDRTLRMVATKGVVALFNAIEKHQQLNGKKEDKHDHKVKDMSKENFLGLLQASQQKTADKSVAKTSWAVVQDDYMMDAKLKDWDNQHGTEMGRVRHQGDVDVEAVEDVAWKTAADALESEKNEDPQDVQKTTKRRSSSLTGKRSTCGRKKSKC